MSTGPEHYRAAERLLDGDPLDQAAALVHAILALVAATREIGDQLDTIPRPRQPRICMIPNCGCDGTWHP